ncbi:MAG: UDP-N-acetylmuramoyl-tripeptide--D-alanyl-D-alanine ligase [Bacteroidales bacterium]|nr:UDP-N-acetylmuramoyl-tripeptide--D-alanyl-D-alanine ligase [Bacteroidales bacterium]
MEYNNKCYELNDVLFEQVLTVFKQSMDLTTDSRKVKQGSIFVALRGENFDGNDFALQALNQGAALAVIDRQECYADTRMLRVENTLEFLQRFAAYYRNTFSIPVLAISGTNGKTTTKELVAAVLQTGYRICATQGNLNNHIGVPLTLLSMKEDCQVAIIEMGASHVGDIDLLCRIARPTLGLLTNIGTAHIEGFGSQQAVVQTKTELFRFLDAEGGTAFVNNDDKNLSYHKPKNSITYSLHRDGCIQGRIVDRTDATACLKVENQGTLYSNLIGAYNCYNMLAAYAVGKYFHIEFQTISAAIERYIPSNNRSQIKKTSRNKLVLDCYNANPTSCWFALDAFKDMYAKKKCVFLGSMKELGAVSRQAHAEIADIVIKSNPFLAVFVGEEYNLVKQSDNVMWFADVQQAKEAVGKLNIQDALILIKGSRATQMEQLADVL